MQPCSTCGFWIAPKPVPVKYQASEPKGECRRYPATLLKLPQEGCGEHTAWVQARRPHPIQLPQKDEPAVMAESPDRAADSPGANAVRHVYVPEPEPIVSRPDPALIAADDGMPEPDPREEAINLGRAMKNRPLRTREG